ncbi:MAG: peptide transporter, partial [Synergistaceae bacterium]
GLMVGAGMASLVQIAYVLYKTNKDNSDTVSEDEGTFKLTVTPKATRRALTVGFIVYMLLALVIAVFTGIYTQLAPGKFALWIAWAGFSSFVAPILIGLCAMRSGWFPGTAVTIIFLTIGLFMGFNPVALALLCGFVGCTGPCFADLGFDLKTGWIIRGNSMYLGYEKDGRRQQVISAMIGAVIGFAVVAAFMHVYFRLDLLPPTSRVMAATAQAAGNSEILMELLKWGAVGMAIQFITGQKKAIGILLATGLLLNAPMYGIGVLLAVIVRLVAGKAFMEIREAGMIAGDGIYGFVIAVLKAF